MRRSYHAPRDLPGMELWFDTSTILTWHTSTNVTLFADARNRALVRQYEENKDRIVLVCSVSSPSKYMVSDMATFFIRQERPPEESDFDAQDTPWEVDLLNGFVQILVDL